MEVIHYFYLLFLHWLIGWDCREEPDLVLPPGCSGVQRVEHDLEQSAGLVPSVSSVGWEQHEVTLIWVRKRSVEDTGQVGYHLEDGLQDLRATAK